MDNATSTVEVVEGSIRVRHADALGAMPISFAAGTRLVFDAQTDDADLRTYGLNRADAVTPFTAEEARLAVTISGDAATLRSGTHLVALMTVKSADAEAVRDKLSIGKPCTGVRCTAVTITPAGEGRSTISARLEPIGLLMLVR